MIRKYVKLRTVFTLKNRLVDKKNFFHVSTSAHIRRKYAHTRFRKNLKSKYFPGPFQTPLRHLPDIL